MLGITVKSPLIIVVNIVRITKLEILNSNYFNRRRQKFIKKILNYAIKISTQQYYKTLQGYMYMISIL